MIRCLRFGQIDDLKNEMIISRTREPSVESISELDALSPEEAQRLARKRLAQMTENLDNLAPAVIERLAREELRGANVSLTLRHDTASCSTHNFCYRSGMTVR